MKPTITEAQHEELLSIVDEHAGKEHREGGAVARSLRAVIERHAAMLEVSSVPDVRATAVAGELALSEMSEEERRAFLAAFPACTALEMVRLCLSWLATEVVNFRDNHDPDCTCGWDLGVLGALDKIREELLISVLGPPGQPADEDVAADSAAATDQKEESASGE